MPRSVESLQREMAQHRKNLDKLEEQKAKYGLNVPLDILNAIDQEKAELARIEALLAGREVPTSALPPAARPSSPAVVHGDVVYGDKVGGDAVGGDKIDTGGGAYIGGSVKVEGGDFVGRDKVTVTRTGAELDEVAALFQQALELARAPQRPPEEREDLEAAVEMAQQETEKGEEADTSLLNKALDVLLEKGPDVLEIVLEAILKPATAAGKGARMLAREAKKSLEKRRKGWETTA
jgi:hypothetical protein